ncbi:glycosyltransferase family 39 protein [Nocardia blacklockiae]|uniref:glycosyltransferase family 39 protein n=1 Tax=Nocardia blacklockiae TaxID=480036 RepID=UPI001894F206|nr:glycosyltransferase family 39 protein [Nocardia blacklockiae]MBF6174813.1 glycosyltransferase family 39 protein [Nocardia blacklockiae]
MYYVAVIFAVVLVAVAGRYGYHRDELYFLAAGRHLDWGYPDQPPLVPALARVMSAIDPDSLVLLRFPAVVAATVVVLVTGLMARELGGGRLAGGLAAGAAAISTLVVATGHLLSTTTFDLALWSSIVLLVVRLAGGRADRRLWLAVGVLVGLGLQTKALLVIPVLALVAALLLMGPRKVFATRYFPLGVVLAALTWLPYLWWQARNGWPQWELSRAIAGGSSGTSNSRGEFVALQFVLIGLFLVPLWGFGWWRLWRDRRYRAFPVAYVLLFAVYLVLGGKAYYLGGMYRVLLAAGSVPLAGLVSRHRKAWAAVVPVAMVQAAVSVVVFLPVLPVATLSESPVPAINYDVGETVGWPEFVRQVAAARHRDASDAPILTANYGEAGAIERFGAPYDLPTPHSGHNAYWWWGPPPAAVPVLTVGIPRDELESLCADLHFVANLDNGLNIANDEQHAPLFTCTPRSSWQQLWPRLRRSG